MPVLPFARPFRGGRIGVTDPRDITLEANLGFSRQLDAKGIPHWLDVWRWAKHDWPLWRDMFPRYLEKL
jgi:esterase/lipase superfamily enzyme